MKRSRSSTTAPAATLARRLAGAARLLAAGVVAGAMSGAAAAVEPAAATLPDRRFEFTVYLNETAVGRHRFVVHPVPDGSEVTSTARFDFKLLGMTIYRYEHEARERWRGDCLAHLTSHTDANGTLSQVDDDPGGCQMSFAYWNPLMLKQTSLINAQTGLQQPVTISAVGPDPIMVRGQTVAAQRYHIAGPKHPIDIWYSPEGEWLGLESDIGSGRTLRYRLELEPAGPKQGDAPAGAARAPLAPTRQ
jgi:hypothetical protein